jgi:DNA-directed RNA polymerase specialized sigma24 family protein
LNWNWHEQKRKDGVEMGKSTISPDVIKVIKKSVDEAVKKAAGAIIKAHKEFDASQRNYFKETERLLYSLPALRIKVAQDEEDLRNGLVSPPEKSRDIVKPSQGGYRMHDPDAREERYIEQRKESMGRTKKEIQRIERALETIQDDEYYDIIPLKYWDLMQPAQIAEALNCDERTYYRQKNRLVNKLKVVLFGADAL